MPIYRITSDTFRKPYGNKNLMEHLKCHQDPISDYPEVIRSLKLNARYLQDLSIYDLLGFFDTLADRWLNMESRLLDQLAPAGLSFLIHLIRKPNLENLLTAAFRGSAVYLDRFADMPGIAGKIKAVPKGVVTHWLAGNVPMLGMISLLQGILTKNANVLKVSEDNGWIVPMLLSHMRDHNFGENESLRVCGVDLCDTVLCVYCDKIDMDARCELSEQSDIRVAWGGQAAVDAITATPRSSDTEDLIFGPKYSFAVIGRTGLSETELHELTLRLAMDASVFEQHGCNSPHTVFVERSGAVSPLEVAASLAKAMEKTLNRLPKGPIDAGEAYRIVDVRSDRMLSGDKVFSSSGTEWTVVHSEQEGMASPCYSRTVFVRPVDDIYDVLNWVDSSCQTVGLCVDEDRKLPFSEALAEKGIKRITPIGLMTAYGFPWDGKFPAERMVDWVTVG